MPRTSQRNKEPHQDAQASGHPMLRYLRGTFGSPTTQELTLQRSRQVYATLEKGRLSYSTQSNRRNHIHTDHYNFGANDRSFKEETAIPDPIPDTGYYHHTKAEAASTRPSHTFRYKSAQSTLSFSQLSTFSVVPPTLTPEAPSQTSPTQIIPTTVPEDLESVTSSPTTASTTQQHKSATALIVGLTVGSAALLAGSFLLFRLLTRPKKRPRPKPSLPILDDSFSDEKALQDSSPIFGGKERSSFRPGSGGTWTWTQYRPTGLPAVTLPQSAGFQETSTTYGSVGYSPRLGVSQQQNSDNTYLQPPPDMRTHGYSPFPPTIQQVQRSISNVASRFSAASASLYPASPQPDEIGIAIGSASPQTTFTGDGHLALRRKESRKSLEKSRHEELNQSAGIASPRKRMSHPGPYAYDGMEVDSPTVLPYCSPEQAPPVKKAGRTRVKSSYYANGSYPRGSYNSAHKATRSEGHLSSRLDYSQEHLPNMVSDSSSRSELVVVSPQPSLYPDDSVSVVGTRNPSRQGHKKKASEHIPSNRCSQYYNIDNRQGQTNLKRSASNAGERDARGLFTSEAAMSRAKTANAPTERPPGGVNDKPPYLPLPAPLPSLSQMALESADPLGYADYRSPTYSIYGFYETDRHEESRSSTR